MKKQTIKCELFTFDSMDDIKTEIAQKAIEKYRNRDSLFIDYDCAYEFILTAAKCFGFDSSVEDISWSGFWSQGDGASITGNWELENAKNVVKCIKEEFPTNKELIELAQTFQKEIEKITVDSVGIARMYHTRYSHCNTLGVSDYEIKSGYSYDKDEETIKRDADYILEIMKELSGMLYRMLEEEYDNQTSDEYIMQLFIDNEYEFDKDGNIV